MLLIPRLHPLSVGSLLQTDALLLVDRVGPLVHQTGIAMKVFSTKQHDTCEVLTSLSLTGTPSGCNTLPFGQGGLNFIGAVLNGMFSGCGTMVLGAHKFRQGVMHDEAASADVVGCYRNRSRISDCGWHIHPLGTPYASRTSSTFPKRATCWSASTTRTATYDGTASEAKVGYADA